MEILAPLIIRGILRFYSETHIVTLSPASSDLIEITATPERGKLITEVAFSPPRDATSGDRISTDEIYAKVVHERAKGRATIEPYTEYAFESSYEFSKKVLAIITGSDKLKINMVNESSTDVIWGTTIQYYIFPSQYENDVMEYLSNPILYLLKPVIELLKKEKVKVPEIPEVEVVPKPRPKPVPVKGIKGVGWE
ncbi:hypothetical protein DRN52_06310 [Thermococci archaeon]|nr:MAG: hypothetical protein DRN52_06310 [Thermococci archaeon]